MEAHEDLLANARGFGRNHRGGPETGGILYSTGLVCGVFFLFAYLCSRCLLLCLGLTRDVSYSVLLHTAVVYPAALKLHVIIHRLCMKSSTTISGVVWVCRVLVFGGMYAA